MSAANELFPKDDQSDQDDWIQPSERTGLMNAEPDMTSFQVFPKTAVVLRDIANRRGVSVDVAVRDAISTIAMVDEAIVGGAKFYVEDEDNEMLRGLPWERIPKPQSTEDDVSLDASLDEAALLRLARLSTRYGGDMNKTLNIAVAIELFFIQIQEGGYQLGIRSPEDEGTIRRLRWRFPSVSPEALASPAAQGLNRARTARAIASAGECVEPETAKIIELEVPEGNPPTEESNHLDIVS